MQVAKIHEQAGFAEVKSEKTPLILALGDSRTVAAVAI
jgi:hypothetical protein